MSSADQAPIETRHQATEFTQGHDQVMQEKTLAGGLGSNFLSSSAPNDFEEEKLIGAESINDVAHNNFEANEHTQNHSEAQANLMQPHFVTPQFFPSQLNSPTGPEPFDDEMPVIILHPMYIL